MALAAAGICIFVLPNGFSTIRRMTFVTLLCSLSAVS
jgi:hypothetical protein